MPPKLCGDRIKLFKYRNIRGETGTNYADTDTDAHAHMQAQKSVKNFIDNIKVVVPPSEFIEKLNLATIVEQMTLNTKEIALLEELQSTALAQLSSR